MKLIAVVLMITTLFSCSTKPSEVKLQPNVFDLPSFIRDLRINMNDKKRPVIKSFRLNDKTETKTINSADSSFWALELGQLEQIDLNAPQLKGYLISNTGIEDSLSNLLINEYLINKKEIPIKKLRIYYLDEPDNIRVIHAELNSDNFIAQSTSRIDLWLNRYNNKLLIDSLRISGSDKTIMLEPKNYTLTTKTIWQ